MKKVLAALTILIITCTFSASAFAAPPKQCNDKDLRQARRMAHMNLTDEQQKQLRDLHEKYQKFIDDTYEMRAEMVTLDQQIRMYMETSNPDSAKLKSMVMEKADLASDLDVKRMEFALDTKKIAPELKYIPMGMDSGFYGPGMGYGPRGNDRGHRGFNRGTGFYGPCMNEALPNN